MAQDMDIIYRGATTSVTDKMNALLRAFPEGRFFVLLDNFEDKVNTKTLTIEDDDVNEALTALLTSEPHAVKMIITTRIAPKKLALVEPAKQRRLDLDEGLESPFAENILREMDTDGKVGLKEASDKVLDEARRRTNGYPRALEALFAILSSDRETSLAEVLADAKKLLPEHVVKKMVGEAYSRLDSDAQMVMQALAIYGRPVSNVAVDYLLQPHLEGIDSAKVLKRLVNMQFVRKEGTHYYLHPVDREYALSRIPQGGPDDRFLADRLTETEVEAASVFSQYALLNRGAQYFKETRLPRKDWKNLDDLTPQLAEFELRFQSQDFDTALGVLLEIDFDYLMLWGHSRQVLEYHLRLQGKIEDDSLKADSLSRLGLCYENLGDYQKAIEHHQQSLDIAREIGNRQGEGAALGNLGLCYYNLGDYQKAIEHHQQALDIKREICSRQGEGIALGNLGNCYNSLGDYQKAIEHHQQSLDIAREVGDRKGEGNALNNLGNCYYRLGDYQKAIEHYQQSLDITREIDDRQGEGAALGNLGICYHNLGDYQKAIDHHQQYLDISREIGNRQGEGIALGNLGLCYGRLGDYPKAIEHLQQSLDIFREIGNRQGEGGSLGNLGNCYDSLGDYQKAIEHQQQSLDIAREIDDRDGQGHSLNNLARALLFLGDTDLAQAHLHTAAEIWEETGSPDVVEAYVVLSISLLKSGQYRKGKTNLEKARRQADTFLEQATRVETIDLKALALCGLTVCEHDKTNADKAREAFAQARAITKAKGQVDRVLKFFDLIAESDDRGLLAGLREVAAGNEK
jgi:tetratricopeptide (TPR) repeat protein